MAYNITLTGDHNKEALQLLESTTRILDSCDIPYWLDGGTLLGIVREKRLLPWDNDVDLSVLYPGAVQLKKLIGSLKAFGLRVRVKKIKETDAYFSKNNIRVLKIRNSQFFGLLKGNVCLEIFIRYKKGEQTYCKIGNTIHEIPLSFCNEVKKISFNKNSYSIPHLEDDYLTHKYGNWRKTVKEWSVFKQDESII